MRHTTYECDWCNDKSEGAHWLEVWILPTPATTRDATALAGVKTELCPKCASKAGRVLESARGTK